ncbi:MAG: NADP-dependent glyceraldehyde-3-phosphate dehydrogenase [Myxococcales bacterium]|nr:NADP-dependent glyceraldehyde-3-phosphate dehydrogenase [Myxococcales bacterium]MDP3503400.1 NADP-dependent glyceraldehyde-3-phosphate dehydrogenase [Myxococcales bacterium]
MRFSVPTEAEIPESVRLGPPLHQREYLVGGVLVQWQGPLNDVFSPVSVKQADGTVSQRLMGSTPLLTTTESLQALDAAVKAWDLGRGPWPTMPVGDRIAHVERFLVAMRAKRSEVVKLLMWEIGKPLKDAEREFDRTVEYIVDTISALKDADRHATRFVHEQGIMGQVRRVPLGVALCMGPYNYPLNETFSTMFPALLMGNPVIFKPAKFGVLLVQPLLEAFRDCFPPGVVNVIYGRGRETVGALMESGKVDVLAFIGTNKGANDLKRLHPRPHRLKSVLGLDAKNIGIVMADADLDEAVKECALGTLTFNGQRCTAIKLVMVHRQLADAFVSRFVSQVESLKAGLPWESGVTLTALPEPGKTQYLQGLLADAQKHGAKVMNAQGGEVSGAAMTPAVLYPVTRDMRLWHEEQFGPLVPITVFDDEQQVIDAVVESPFGQQVSLFGKDAVKMGRVIDACAHQVGRINLNSQCQRGPDSFPFNGRKDSAEGTLSVTDALRVFSIRTVVAAKVTEKNKQVVRDILTGRHSAFLSTDYLL